MKGKERDVSCISGILSLFHSVLFHVFMYRFLVHLILISHSPIHMLNVYNHVYGAQIC